MAINLPCDWKHTHEDGWRCDHCGLAPKENPTLGWWDDAVCPAIARKTTVHIWVHHSTLPDDFERAGARYKVEREDGTIQTGKYTSDIVLSHKELRRIYFGIIIDGETIGIKAPK